MNRETLNQEMDEKRQQDDVAESRIAEMAEAVDLELPTFPVETGDVVRMVDAFGYRASADFIFNLLEEGVIHAGRIGGKRKWLPADVYRLLTVVESLRRWKLHKFHMHKLSAVEKLQLEAEAAGAEHAFDDLDDFSVEQLVHIMEQSEQSAVRHAIRVALIAKLRAGGLL